MGLERSRGMISMIGMVMRMSLGGATRVKPPTSRAFAGSRKKGDLRYAPLHSRMLCRNYVVQQISPCFLQDLQSEWKKEQMQKSYKGVKSEKRCEIVTVGRRAARGGESRSHQT